MMVRSCPRGTRHTCIRQSANTQHVVV